MFKLQLNKRFSMRLTVSRKKGKKIKSLGVKIDKF